MDGTLFLKYGGTPLLEAVVDDFYSKAVEHEKFRHYFEGHDIQRLKNHQAAFLAVLMGAPSTLYTGRGMRDAHRHLNITHDAFDAMTFVLEESLRQGGMEEQDVGSMLEMLQRFRDEVVTQDT